MAYQRLLLVGVEVVHTEGFEPDTHGWPRRSRGQDESRVPPKSTACRAPIRLGLFSSRAKPKEITDDTSPDSLRVAVGPDSRRSRVSPLDGAHSTRRPRGNPRRGFQRVSDRGAPLPCVAPGHRSGRSLRFQAAGFPGTGCEAHSASAHGAIIRCRGPARAGHPDGAGDCDRATGATGPYLVCTSSGLRHYAHGRDCALAHLAGPRPGGLRYGVVGHHLPVERTGFLSSAYRLAGTRRHVPGDSVVPGGQDRVLHHGGGPRGCRTEPGSTGRVPLGFLGVVDAGGSASVRRPVTADRLVLGRTPETPIRPDPHGQFSRAHPDAVRGLSFGGSGGTSAPALDVDGRPRLGSRDPAAEHAGAGTALFRDIEQLPAGA